MRSVSTRLISSGMVQSSERSPASRWATGTPSLAAASAQASVEFTSPATTTRSGRRSNSTCSKPIEDLAGLVAVGAGPDFEAHVRLREAEVAEDVVGEAAVVVLSGVNDELAGVPAPAHRLDDRRHLHEVRTGAHDVGDQRAGEPGPGVRTGAARAARVRARARSSVVASIESTCL